MKDDLCTTLNQMFLAKTTTKQQKHRAIVCLPKPSGSQRSSNFRPITHLNADYKLLARIIAQLLRPLMAEHLQATQFCGEAGNTILDAVATVREVVAKAETTLTRRPHGRRIMNLFRKLKLSCTCSNSISLPSPHP